MGVGVSRRFGGCISLCGCLFWEDRNGIHAKTSVNTCLYLLGFFFHFFFFFDCGCYPYVRSALVKKGCSLLRLSSISLSH